MKQQKKTGKSVRKVEKIENKDAKARRLHRWRMLMVFSASLIVICLILLYFMGEL